MNHQPRKRVKHYDEPGHAHFLTFSCYRRMPLLGKDRTRRWLIDAISRAVKKHQFHVCAWVIMPEHVHLLLWPTNRYSIAERLRSIKMPVAKRAIAYLQQCAPGFLNKLAVRSPGQVKHRFWQAGPRYDRNVTDPRQVYAIIDYIHNNPVTRGLVERATAWKWSSANDWLANRMALIPLQWEALPTHVITE